MSYAMMQKRILDQVKAALTAAVLCACIVTVATAPACTSVQVQNTVNQIDQYLPVALSIATDILAALPLLTSQVSPQASSSLVTDAQQASDAVNLSIQAVNAYLKSKSSADLGKIQDSLNNASASFSKILADLHITNVQTVAKITAWVNLAKSVLGSAAAIAGGVVSSPTALMAAPRISVMQAQVQLAAIDAMPLQ